MIVIDYYNINNRINFARYNQILSFYNYLYDDMVRYGYVFLRLFFDKSYELHIFVRSMI